MQLDFEREAGGQPFVGIPLCNVFQQTYPRPEIMLSGVEEPPCLIHPPNESVDPSEIENMALTEALFLQEYALSRPPART